MRLGVMSRAEFARAFDVTPPSYTNWVDEDASTGAYTLVSGLRQLGVWDLDRTLAWLADGQGREPAWLEDPSLDPFTAPSPKAGSEIAWPRDQRVILAHAALGTGIALCRHGLPTPAASYFSEARDHLRGVVMSGKATPPVFRALASLEEGLEAAESAQLVPDHRKQPLPRLDSNQDEGYRRRFGRGHSIGASTPAPRAHCA